MFLRTSYRVLQRFCTRSQDRHFQGTVKGNGAALLIWLMLSIFLVHYLCDSKLVPVRKPPISVDTYQITAFLCVDDADLVALNNIIELATKSVGRAQLFINK